MLQLLAGPIVRRVEPRLAAVWVALNEPCKVSLDIYVDVQTAGSLPQPQYHAEASTIRILNWLHIALVCVEVKDTSVFVAERIYSYNLSFTREGGGVETLRSLNLLVNRSA